MRARKGGGGGGLIFAPPEKPFSVHGAAHIFVNIPCFRNPAQRGGVGGWGNFCLLLRFGAFLSGADGSFSAVLLIYPLLAGNGAGGALNGSSNL